MTKVPLAAAIVGLALVAPPADAASTRMRQCVITGTMTFSPRLTTTVRSGSISYTYTPTCVVEQTNGVVGIETYTASLTLDYEGSCLTARISDPWSSSSIGVLASGTAMVLVMPMLSGGSSGAGAYALVPAGFNPCDMTSAAVVQVSSDVEPGSIP